MLLVARATAYLILDRRLADSVRSLAVDPAQTVGRRTYFLRLLTRYATPNVGLNESATGTQGGSAVLSLADPTGKIGQLPMNREARNRVRATIASMGNQDPDANLRRLAAMVATELQSYPQ